MSIRDDSRRLVAEVRAVQERWAPRATLRTDGTGVWWEVDLVAEGNVLPIRVFYPDNYPASPPTITPRRPLPLDTPHRFGGETLCWYYAGTRRSRNRWDPGRDTAAVAIGAAYRWFLAFLVWRTTGQWPVRDAKET